LNWVGGATGPVYFGESAQSEQDFSSVGRTITDARSRLSPQTVEAMELIR